MANLYDQEVLKASLWQPSEEAYSVAPSRHLLGALCESRVTSSVEAQPSRHLSSSLRLPQPFWHK